MKIIQEEAECHNDFLKMSYFIVPGIDKAKVVLILKELFLKMEKKRIIQMLYKNLDYTYVESIYTLISSRNFHAKCKYESLIYNMSCLTCVITFSEGII